MVVVVRGVRSRGCIILVGLTHFSLTYIVSTAIAGLVKGAFK